MAPEQTRRRGFTLIELLVVIAIISILVSILVPSLRKARDLLSDTLCISNNRGYGQGALLYMEDYDGATFSWNGWNVDGTAGGGYVRIYHYLTPRYVDSQWWDPAFKRRDWALTNRDHWHYSQPATWGGVYDRSWDTCTSKNVTGKTTLPVRINELRYPETTALIMCYAPRVCPGPGEAYSEYGGYTGSAMHLNGTYDPWPMHYDRTTTVVTRLDGSVRPYPWVELVDPANWAAKLPGVVPYGPSGQRIARKYLWSGYSPASSGWMPE